MVPIFPRRGPRWSKMSALCVFPLLCPMFQSWPASTSDHAVGPANYVTTLVKTDIYVTALLMTASYLSSLVPQDSYVTLRCVL